MKRTSMCLYGIVMGALLPASLASAQDGWAGGVGVQVNVSYGTHPQQVVDLYLQGVRLSPPEMFRRGTDPTPTLIWFHGGGWLGGDKAVDFPLLLSYLERGWNVVNVNYRLGPGTAPSAVDDAMCAYKWVVEEQEATRGGSSFVVSGASAGGQLALIVGLLNASGAQHPCKSGTAPKAIVNWYGVADIAAEEEFLSSGDAVVGNFVGAWLGDRAPEERATAMVHYSPVVQAHPSAPHLITVHGTADRVVPYAHSVRLHEAWPSDRNELVTLEGGTHGGFTLRQYEQANTAIFTFLERALR